MLLKLIPEYRDYIWGGQRLRPGQRTAEAWVLYANDRVAAGPYAGQTLGEVTATLGAALLGSAAPPTAPFPLLIKLLDCAEWLSVQVHPNDEQATRLEGPGHSGKTEAWHVLEATPAAQVIAGLKPGTDHATLAAALRTQTLLDWVTYQTVQRGDTLFMPAGMLHALGPGLLIYEVQQTSDITYRVFDWGRPATANRPLHLEKSLAVLDPTLNGQPRPAAALQPLATQTVALCPYFQLELLTVAQAALPNTTAGRSFHALTAIAGHAEIICGPERLRLQPFETVLLTADSDPYQLTGHPSAQLLRASLP